MPLGFIINENVLNGCKQLYGIVRNRWKSLGGGSLTETGSRRGQKNELFCWNQLVVINRLWDKGPSRCRIRVNTLCGGKRGLGMAGQSPWAGEQCGQDSRGLWVQALFPTLSTIWVVGKTLCLLSPRKMEAVCGLSSGQWLRPRHP